eukprot:TRINITY_DN4319_c0_g1_i1.p1 TRINITY_DN4319_c0_g1~~TRINITY_DN4319_c0_g1_i1.p1  ORF type:complete len:309 (+),score=67.06 TRINITY_DN4319_c0_g1_i1:3-929(+)
MSKGTSNVLSKLEKSIKDGNYYEAQQMYKTLFSRYKAQKKYNEAKQLLIQGSRDMLQHGRYTEGTDLAGHLIDIYTQGEMKPTMENLEPLIEIFKSFGNKPEAMGPRDNFMKSALKWSPVEGEASPLLHSTQAEAYDEEGNYSKAEFHYLHGQSVDKFAQMILKCSKMGYLNEQDLFIVRAVLQYLSIGNLSDANKLFDVYMNINPSLPQTPLINFTKFLLLTLERDAYPLFQKLKDRYRMSISRDPSFAQYLDTIAHLFFGIKPAKGGGNFLTEMMKNLFSGGPLQNDIEEEESSMDIQPQMDDELD